MHGCDNPQGFDREACGGCEACRLDMKRIQIYEAKKKNPDQLIPPYVPMVQEELIDDAIKEVIDQILNLFLGQINSKYIHTEAIRADLNALAREYVLHVKKNFDQHKLICDDHMHSLVRQMIEMVMPEVSDEEITDFDTVAATVLEIFRD